LGFSYLLPAAMPQPGDLMPWLSSQVRPNPHHQLPPPVLCCFTYISSLNIEEWVVVKSFHQ